MKSILLLIFVLGAVIFTSIQAKEEMAKVKASQEISIDSHDDTNDYQKVDKIILK